MVLVSMVIYCNGEINKGRHELKPIKTITPIESPHKDVGVGG